MYQIGIQLKSGILLFILILTASLLQAQGSKKIRELGIKSRTISVIYIEEGMDKPVPKQKEIYNEQGDIIELIEYNEKGDITKWEKYAYDNNGNVIEEIKLNKNGMLKDKIITIDENNLKLEKHYFNSQERMYRKKIYEYVFSE